MTRPPRWRADVPGLLLASIGAVQIALVALALARVLDPGWPVFDAVGSLAGLGMAGAAAIVRARYAGSRTPAGARSLVAVASGLVSAAVWLTLAGHTFFTSDYGRIVLLAATDTVYVLWMVWAAIAFRRSWIPGLRGATLLLVIRTGVELASLPLLFASSSGPGTGMAPVLISALAVWFGWMVLAAWEIRLGTVAPPRP